MSMIRISPLIFGLFFVFSVPFGSRAQIKLGVSGGPSLSFTRVLSALDSLDARPGPVAFGFRMDMLMEVPLTERYSFVTGLNYISKGRNVEFLRTLPDQDRPESRIDEHRLQYIGTKATLRLHTDDIGPTLGLRFFLEGGPQMYIKTSDRPVPFKKKDSEVQSFFPVDLNLLVTGGVELDFGVETSLFTGFSYQHIPHDVDSRTRNFPSRADLYLREGTFSLIIGIKF
ncbi:MAG: hypothetical protein OXB93_00530 [Cytophagales bacterium]|nr:hypothetical protein [Cytophagales bacterium]